VITCITVCYYCGYYGDKAIRTNMITSVFPGIALLELFGSNAREIMVNRVTVICWIDLTVITVKKTLLEC
jgi:hypothetical protein